MCFIVIMHAAGAEKRGMITYNVAYQDVTLPMNGDTVGSTHGIYDVTHEDDHNTCN